MWCIRICCGAVRVFQAFAVPSTPAASFSRPSSTPAVSHLYSAPLLASFSRDGPRVQSPTEDYTRHRAHPYLRKIETAGGWKAYEKAHRTKLLATFVPKFTHLVPKELVPLIVEFSFHVGFY